MKLELIKYDNANWLEATWKEIKTITLPQEVDENGMADMVLRTSEVEIQVHCESFSGHAEHIAMLRAKALEYGTELDEAIVKELEESYEAPTQAELDDEAKKAKLQEAYAYLSSTAWYIERLNDPSSGKEVPQEVFDGRANARLTINELEG